MTFRLPILLITPPIMYCGVKKTIALDLLPAAVQLAIQVKRCWQTLDSEPFGNCILVSYRQSIALSFILCLAYISRLDNSELSPRAFLNQWKHSTTGKN